MSDPPIQKDAMVEESKQAHEAVNSALKAETGGAPVHTFNPDTSAEKKKAELMKNVEIPQILEPKSALATDIGSADTEKVTETLTESPKEEASTASKAPGAYADVPIKGLPDWYNVGWTDFSNLPNPGDEAAMAEFSKTHTPEQIKQLYEDRSRPSNGDYENDLVAQFLDEKYFGEWFHNCGVVFVAIFFTWLLTRVRFGLMSCFIVGAFFGK
jgi:Ca2+-dependent lipid-binding protein